MQTIRVNKAVEMFDSVCRNLCIFFDMLQPLDSHKFAGVKQVLNRNIAHTAKQHPVNPQLLVKAPLATPEHIEIGQEYATVRVRLLLHLSATDTFWADTWSYWTCICFIRSCSHTVSTM